MKTLIEQQIRELLKEDISAARFSQIVFGQGGLFNQLGPTEAERRLVTQTELYRQARARFRALRRQEAAPLHAETDRVNAALARAHAAVAASAGTGNGEPVDDQVGSTVPAKES